MPYEKSNKEIQNERAGFKMKGMSFGNEDKKILDEANKLAISQQKARFESGETTRKEFKSAKKEIKKYTDVQSAKDFLAAHRPSKKPKTGRWEPMA
jgi:hypothetical protein